MKYLYVHKCARFIPLPLILTFCITKVQYQNQVINIDTIHGPYLDFISYTRTHLCAYVYNLYAIFIMLILCNYHHNQDTKLYHHPAPNPNPLKPLICCPYIYNFISRVFYKWNHAVLTYMRLTFSALHNFSEIHASRCMYQSCFFFIAEQYSTGVDIPQFV